MGWWISRAPQLEEDVALANIGLDQLGQARTLLAYAGEVEGDGRGEDDLAYLRDERDFRNVKLVERAQTDFGVAMARLLVFSDLAGRAVRRARAQHRRDPRRGRRQGGQGGRLPPSTTPTSGCCGSATAPTSPTPGCRPRSTPSGRTSRSCSTARPSTPAWSPTGVAVDPATLREPVLARITAVVERRHPDRARGRRPPSAVAAAGCTPRRWATCSPRCSTSPARTRG